MCKLRYYCDRLKYLEGYCTELRINDVHRSPAKDFLVLTARYITTAYACSNTRANYETDT